MAEVTQQLDTPILLDSIRFVHFFEGRVLTGRDLRDQQRADAQARHALGRATGAGVVHGLEVSLGASTGVSPVVTVESGLAVNRDGEAIVLEHAMQLELSRQLPGAADTGGVLFGPCVTPSGALPVSDELTTVASGHGFYVLTVMPASGFQENAPKTGLDDGGVAAGCGRRYDTRGRRFLLRRIEVTAMVDLASDVRQEIISLADTQNTAQSSRLRNLVAHAMFGDAGRRLASDPYAPDLGTYGMIDQPLDQILSCEVPLALIRWTSAGVQFVDNWSVRRRSLARPQQSEWPLFLAQRRYAEQEARWLQFHAHLAELDSSVNLANIDASAYFRFLPACGVLPLADGAHFFAGNSPQGPLVVPGAQLTDMVETGIRFPFMDLNSIADVRLFRMAENQGQTPYLVYQSAEIPSLPWFRDEWETKCAELQAAHDALEERIELLEQAGDISNQLGTISGTVSARIFFGLGLSSFALPNVDVEIRPVNGGNTVTVQTSGIGAFSAPGLVPGTYNVRVDTGEALLPVYDQNHVLAPNATVNLNINLTHRLQTGTITGQLEDPRAESDRTVNLLDDEGNVVRTVVADERGVFAFEAVDAGNYRLAFAGDERRELTVGINGGTSVNINVPRGVR